MIIRTDFFLFLLTWFPLLRPGAGALYTQIEYLGMFLVLLIFSFLPFLSFSVSIDYDDFVVANTDAIGIYRVNYDSDMWNAIINKLKSTSFKVRWQNSNYFVPHNLSRYIVKKQTSFILLSNKKFSQELNH